MVSVQARRKQAHYAIERRLSHRQACALIGTSRSNLHYQLKMPVKNGPVVVAMKRLSGMYPRFELSTNGLKVRIVEFIHLIFLPQIPLQFAQQYTTVNSR
jgi:putative transposase